MINGCQATPRNTMDFAAEVVRQDRAVDPCAPTHHALAPPRQEFVCAMSATKRGTRLLIAIDIAAKAVN